MKYKLKCSMRFSYHSDSARGFTLPLFTYMYIFATDLYACKTFSCLKNMLSVLHEYKNSSSVKIEAWLLPKSVSYISLKRHKQNHMLMKVFIIFANVHCAITMSFVHSPVVKITKIGVENCSINYTALYSSLVTALCSK